MPVRALAIANPTVKLIGMYIHGQIKTENKIDNIVCSLRLTNRIVNMDITIPAVNIIKAMIKMIKTTSSIRIPLNLNHLYTFLSYQGYSESYYSFSHQIRI